ncbi:MAG TPA: 50S ribosomal protein L3 [Syntrophaceae bacterium]|nr:50S ribosomal protein L3 [Syntrophaceae bacterium]
MINGILAIKLGMSRIFGEDGTVIPVTVLKAGPCIVTQKKTTDVDGYNAIQVGFLEKKVSRTNKPLLGHFKKSGDKAFYHVKEFPIDDTETLEVGQKVTVEMFKPGELVHVTGVSKGRGFAGVIKRWGFRRHPETHGSTSHRRPGSIGGSSFPSRVIKGKRMPGHMGSERVTVKNLKVIDVRAEQNLLLLKGAVPGSRKSLIIVKRA